MLITTTLAIRLPIIGSLIKSLRQVLPKTTTQNIVVEPIKPNSALENDAASTPKSTLTTTTTTNIGNHHDINANNETPTFNRQTNSTVTVAVAKQFSTHQALAAKSTEERAGLPPPPKRPASAYMRFLAQERSAFRQQNPTLSQTQTISALAQQWSNIDPQRKERLQAEFLADQRTYQAQRLKYVESISTEQQEELKNARRSSAEQKERRVLRQRNRDAGRPKRPLSAYAIFLKREAAHRPLQSKDTFAVWQRETATRWRQLSQQQKAEYDAEAKKGIEEYKKAIAVWEAEMVRTGNQSIIRARSQAERCEPKPPK